MIRPFDAVIAPRRRGAFYCMCSCGKRVLAWLKMGADHPVPLDDGHETHQIGAAGADWIRRRKDAALPPRREPFSSPRLSAEIRIVHGGTR